MRELTAIITVPGITVSDKGNALATKSIDQRKLTLALTKIVDRVPTVYQLRTLEADWGSNGLPIHSEVRSLVRYRVKKCLPTGNRFRKRFGDDKESCDGVTYRSMARGPCSDGTRSVLPAASWRRKMKPG